MHRFVLHSIEAVAVFTNNTMRDLARIWEQIWVSLLCFRWAVHAAFILIGWEVASGATVGLMFGYLWYLVVHDAVHRRHLRRGSLLYRPRCTTRSTTMGRCPGILV